VYITVVVLIAVVVSDKFVEAGIYIFWLVIYTYIHRERPSRK